MGCAGSTPADEDGPTGNDYASKALDAELERQNAEENSIIKLLVLGTGESGKSTVFKQMKILYSVPDPPSKFIMICRANLYGNAHAVHDGMTRLNITYKADSGKAAAEKLCAMPADGNVSPDQLKESLTLFKDMFADPGVQEAIERANEYQLNDSTVYFWNRADELCAEGYMPTEQDVLRARVRTTGIVQQNFEIEKKKYTMFDVGGQRNERRKWIHCFDNVTAVIFVTAISEYDQVLYEDENTNRMDEALVLFDQICNHPSFIKTSMILFLNKRDLFELKLAKKNLTCWEDNAQTREAGQDYDKCISYIKTRFIDKNKAKELRQVYVHATCATDTKNVAFVMSSVFDIILKENLRKLQKVDVNKLIDMGGGTGVTNVNTATPWVPAKGANTKVVLAAAWFTNNLAEKKVLVSEAAKGELPAVRVCSDPTITATNWEWVMGLGKNLPMLPVIEKELGSFKGDFKKAVEELSKMLGAKDTLGSVYDAPVIMKKGNQTTIVIVVAQNFKALPAAPGYTPVDHLEFENAHYTLFDDAATPNITDSDGGKEFDPFAPNPVGFRWFKGLKLFTEQVQKIPDKGVYLAVFKVCSTTDGFKIMVNEHNRISIPLIFISESQLEGADKKWMHGVRIREDMFNIDLLEGKKPNQGWLGPEMSGEEGATFPEKLWWAVDEAKARLNTDSIGKLYDRELIQVDENDNLQLILYGMLAKNEQDCLPGHIWVSRAELEVQNMKYTCPTVLGGMLEEMQGNVNQVQALMAQDAGDIDTAAKLRTEKKEVIDKIERLFNTQSPLKWVNRIIMWCADGMPSFAKGLDPTDKDDVVRKAIAANSEVEANAEARAKLLQKYKK